MSDDRTALILALVTENAELRVQLREAQDHLIEMAVDAGKIDARIERLQAKIGEAYGRGNETSSRRRSSEKAAPEGNELENSHF